MVNIIYFDLLTNKALFQLRDIVGLFRLSQLKLSIWKQTPTLNNKKHKKLHIAQV